MLFMIVFSSCKQSNASLEQKNHKSLDIALNSNDYTIEKLNDVDTINLNLYDNPKNVYLLFTNFSKINNKIILKNSEDIQQGLQKRTEYPLYNQESSTQHTPKYIMNFNHQPIEEGEFLKELESAKFFKSDSINSNQLFYLEKDLSISTQATSRKIVKNIKTEYGNKTLNIWVSDDSFGENCSKEYCVRQDMVDILADIFLKDGEDNDIYDWITNIFGEEWGEANNGSFISNSNEITILLTDINSDNRVMGGMLGYFYAKDNYKKTLFEGSNERVMFYIDSVLFASHQGQDLWSIENDQTKKVISTLAHEFEHMIHFYQKRILQSSSGLKPWIDEMLAVSVEDIIATKLETKGTRGVSYSRGDAGEDYNHYGRFSLFNKNISQTLPTWSNTREDYAKVSAFGGYLVRNYGGAKLLHDIMHNRYTDEKAITVAVEKSLNGLNKDFGTLMQDWGVAVILSANTDLGVDSGYLYNLGDFLEIEYKNSSYDMGSINFFNYQNKPNIVNKISSIEPKSNFYYKVGSNLTGNINIQIDKSSDVKMTLIVQ